MSRESIDSHDSDDGNVLVDWGTAESTKSYPVRSSQQKVDPTGRNAIALYDSDSSDDEDDRSAATTPNLKNKGRTSLLIQGFRTNQLFVDEEVDSVVVDGMIVSDDDEGEDLDDSDEDVATTTSNWTGDRLRDSIVSTLTSPLSSLATSAAATVTRSSVSAVASAKQYQRDLAALFVDDKPWRTRALNNDNDNRSRSRSVGSPSPQSHQNHDSDNFDGRQLLSPGTMHSTTTLQDDDFSEHDLDDQEEEEISVHSSELSQMDLEESIDWEGLSQLPNSFLGGAQKIHSCMSQYLDENFQRGDILEEEANNFAVDHTLVLRAILQLLEERDQSSLVEKDGGSVVILKQGALKKSSHTVGRLTWKVKYVEVRRGTFSYYEDSADASKQSRKTIFLSDCTCGETEHHKVGGNFVFEIVPNDNSNSKRLLWMCSSEEERQAWLRVIEEAKQEKKRPIDLGPYKDSVNTYTTLQQNLKWSVTKHEYVRHVEEIANVKLKIPIEWVLELEDHTQHHDRAKSTYFWNFLSGHALIINGHTIPAESSHGPERMIGALCRCILEFDRSSQEEQSQHHMSELQSVSYARDTLLAVWQSHSRDDSHFTLDSLCQNPNLVIVLPFSDDPKISLNVMYAPDEEDVKIETESDVSMQLSGWVTTRSKSSKNWKNRYCVVSEGVLSYFEHANPRPHGLKGQVVLVGATLNIVDTHEDSHLYILQILTRDSERERQLSFRERSVYEHWRDAIQRAIDSVTPTKEYSILQETSTVSASGGKRKPKFPTRRTLKKGVEGGGGRMMKGAAEGFKAIKGASEMMFGMVRSKGSSDDRTMGGSSYNIWGSLDHPEELQRVEPPTVQIEADSCRFYKIMTADPTEMEDEDTWMTVRARTYQKFKMSGGAQGRFTKAEEVVELQFVNGLVKNPSTSRVWELSNNSSSTSLYG